MHQPFEIDTVNLLSFDLKGKPKPLIRGSYMKCKRNDHLKSDHMIKIVRKNEENDLAVESELKAYRNIRHPCLCELVYYFTDPNNHYLVYSKTEGKNLLKNIIKNGALKKECIQILAVQFYSFLESLHKAHVFYLRPTIDNLFVDQNLRLSILGLDYSGIDSGSSLLLIDPEPSIGTDLICLGYFLTYCHKGQLPTDPFCLSSLSKSLPTDQRSRDSFDPRQSSYLRPELHVQTNHNFLRINRDLELNWSSGFYLKAPGIQIGYDNGIFFKYDPDFSLVDQNQNTYDRFDPRDPYWEQNGDSSIAVTMSSNNVKVIDNSSGSKTTIDIQGIVVQNQAKNFDLTFNFSGIYIVNEHGSVHHDGNFELAMCRPQEGVLKITNKEVETTFSDYSRSVKEGVLTFCVDDFDLTLDRTMKCSLGNCGMAINGPKTDLVYGSTELKISDSLEMNLGGISIGLWRNGATFKSGNFIAVISDDEMKVDVNGFHILVDSTGPKITSPYDIDFTEYLTNVPHTQMQIEHFDLPQAPKLPVVTLKQNQNVGKLDDFLNKGERVKLVSDCIKTRLFSKKERKVVLTSTGRVFYCTPSFTQKMGDIDVGPKSSLVVKNGGKLIVTNSNGKKFDLYFPEGETIRNNWASELKSLIARTQS